MNLWGPLGRVQRSGARFYLKLAERFRENTVVRETWEAMARDLDEQAESLKGIRPAVWVALQKEEKTLLAAVEEIEAVPRAKSSNPQDWTLHTCLIRTLDFEELIALKLYAPLIYRLRSQSGRALDFYVIVNAHLTRLARLIQPFSGDPVAIQRCADLFQRFEKEAQGPPPQPVVLKKKAKRVAAATRVKAAKRVQAKPKRAHGRGKLLVKNLKLSKIARRRARG
jgi:hypothetical protein